jgi:hypothetical protein
MVSIRTTSQTVRGRIAVPVMPSPYREHLATSAVESI